MHNTSDAAAYVGSVLSAGAGVATVSGLELANEIAQLLATIIGGLSGAASLAYFLWKWRKERRGRK